jgi:hypothetical protein
MVPLDVLCSFFARYLPPLVQQGGLMLLPDAWAIDWNAMALVPFALVKRCVHSALLPLLRALMFRLEMDSLLYRPNLNEPRVRAIHAPLVEQDALDLADADEALMTRQEQHLAHLDFVEPFDYLPETPGMRGDGTVPPHDIDAHSSRSSPDSPRYSPASDPFEFGVDQLEQGYRWGSAVDQLYDELAREGADTIYGL